MRRYCLCSCSRFARPSCLGLSWGIEARLGIGKELHTTVSIGNRVEKGKGSVQAVRWQVYFSAYIRAWVGWACSLRYWKIGRNWLEFWI